MSETLNFFAIFVRYIKNQFLQYMRYISFFLIAMISLLLLHINIRLHSDNFTVTGQKNDIVLQMNFLESELKDNNLGDRMQELFPEGNVFIHVLYGLSWCELALANPSDKMLNKRAVKEVLLAYDHVNSENARSIFNTYTTPENGIYYIGWKNYLLSKILSIDIDFDGRKSYMITFLNECDAIQKLINGSANPYFESYPNQAWPADTFVAIASLGIHDKILAPKYNLDINHWLTKVKLRLDPVTKMIPHMVDAQAGKLIHGARGCSTSLILRMLAEIDPVFAEEQFKLFKTYFVTTTFGLPSVREYPVGQYGSGDIDSGPVVFGVGFSGTIVSIGTYAVFDQGDLSTKQYKTIHAFGLGQITQTEKSYLLGQLPMADAFIAWGRATDLHFQNKSKAVTAQWPVQFHFLSFVTVLLLWIIYFFKKLSVKVKMLRRNVLNVIHSQGIKVK
jgi:hypothetical protein